jgi:hypothetical protein
VQHRRVASQSTELADRFDVALARFETTVRSLDSEQWQRRGVNTPGRRLGNEDEARPVGVIANHVAAWLPRHVTLMRARAAGEEPSKFDTTAINAEEAERFGAVTQQEVLERLLAEAPAVHAFIAGLTDADLGRSWDTPVGPFTLASALEQVLIGHLYDHWASIRASL